MATAAASGVAAVGPEPGTEPGRWTPRLIYALAMCRELVVTLPVANPPPRP
jgi:hypothetical protein